MLRTALRASADGLLAVLALVAAFGLRLNGDMLGSLPGPIDAYVPWLFVGVAVLLPVLLLGLGTYRRPLGEDLATEAWSILLATGVVAGVLAALRLAGLSPFSGSIVVIFGLAFFTAATSLRLMARAQRVLTGSTAAADRAHTAPDPFAHARPKAAPPAVTRQTLGLLVRPAPAAAPRVVVTGGGGYVGSHLVRQLLASGRRVRVLDNFAYGRAGLRDLVRHPHLEIVEGDISSVRDIGRVVQDADAVVALAAIVGDPACSLDANETLAVNYESTKSLVEACRFNGVRRLVFASSCSVYGASNGSDVLAETSPLAPVSLYAQTRVLSEEVLFERCGSMEPVVLRLATAFGLSPRMRYDIVVNALTVRALLDGHFQIYGGHQWRPFVHCHDAANAFLRAVTSESLNVAGEVFNVGSERLNHTLLEVGRLVKDCIPTARMDVAEDELDARNYRVSFDKVARTLGFLPEYDLRTGIREMIDAVRRDEALRDVSDVRFSNFDQYRLRLGAASGTASAP